MPKSTKQKYQISGPTPDRTANSVSRTSIPLVLDVAEPDQYWDDEDHHVALPTHDQEPDPWHPLDKDSAIRQKEILENKTTFIAFDGKEDLDDDIDGVTNTQVRTEAEIEQLEFPSTDVPKENDIDLEWTQEFLEIDNSSPFYLDISGEEDSSFLFSIPNYDPSSQQPLTAEDSQKEDRAQRSARRKASTIISTLNLVKKEERAQAMLYLTDFFERLDHSATFYSLRSLCEEGLGFEILHLMIELRAIWMERSEWWKRRYHGEVVPIPRGYSSLTWRLSCRICLARNEFPPDSMIDQDWMTEWLVAPLGSPGYFSFTDYIAEMISFKEAGVLENGLRMGSEFLDSTEFNTNFHRYRNIEKYWDSPTPWNWS